MAASTPVPVKAKPVVTKLKEKGEEVHVLRRSAVEPPRTIRWDTAGSR